MSRSSIFSFDTWKGGSPFTLALIPILVTLLAVEVVARQDAIWRLSENSSVGMVHAVERELIDGAAPPRVLVMGSSRVRDAVSPVVLERDLGLQRGDVANLSLTGGRLWDVLDFYTRHRSWFKEADVLVVGVESWDFNVSKRVSDRFRHRATLSERVSGHYNTPNTLSLVVGWFWRTYDAQLPLRQAAKIAITRKNPPLAFSEDARPLWNPVGQSKARGPVEHDARSDVQVFFRNYRFNPVVMENLNTILAMAREDGVKVLVFHPPMRDSTIDVIEAKAGEHFTTFQSNIHDLKGVEVALLSRGSAIGLKPEWFRDYGHATTLGSDATSAWLAGELRTRYPELTAPKAGGATTP